MRGDVYFLQLDDGGVAPVKVGFSACIQERIVRLGDWSPYPVRLLATVAGDLKLEARFHALFRRYHMRGEWFQGCKAVVSVAAAVAAGSFDARCLPAPTDIRNKKRVTEWRRARWGLSARMKDMSLPQEIADLAWRTQCLPVNLSSSQEADVTRLWEWLESVAPRPQSKSTILMKRLLQKDAA